MEVENEQGTFQVEQQSENPNLEQGTEIGQPPLIVVVQGGKNVRLTKL